MIQKVNHISEFLDNNIFKYNNNVSINFEIHGMGTDTIVFLHGFGASLRSWDDIIKLFPETEYKLFLIDLKGHGFSSKPKDNKYSIEEQAKIITAFLQSYSLTNVTLCGHSLGGGVALITYLKELKSKKNLRIKKLILIDCAAFKQELPFFIKYLQNPILNFISQNFFPAKYRAKYILKKLFFDKNKVTKKIINRYFLFLRDRQSKFALKQIANQIIPLEYDSIIQNYNDIKIPTLIIWGENDFALPIINGIHLRKLIESSELKSIKECGHIPQEEKPNETFQLIIKFLKCN